MRFFQSPGDLPGDLDCFIGRDRSTGETLVSMRLPEGTGRLVSLPLPTPEGSVVVARQKYSQTSASLMVYRLSALERGGPPVPEPKTTPDGGEDSPSAGAADPSP